MKTTLIDNKLFLCEEFKDINPLQSKECLLKHIEDCPKMVSHKDGCYKLKDKSKWSEDWEWRICKKVKPIDWFKFEIGIVMSVDSTEEQRLDRIRYLEWYDSCYMYCKRNNI